MRAGYYHTKDSVEEYIQMAKDVNSADLINKFLSHLSTDAKILELGSGPGTDWEILNRKLDVVGSDNSQVFLAHLRDTYPKGEFLELDAITLSTDQRFDGIYSNKVMHHLSNDELKDSVKRQSEILNTGGLICHSFWKGEGSEVFKGLFVNYHDHESLREVFEPSFDVIGLEDYQEFDEGDSICLIAKKR
ncbi:MAG: class I SAM-dependent methyltransferase [Cyclobacteriaceae bacterium]